MTDNQWIIQGFDDYAEHDSKCDSLLSTTMYTYTGKEADKDTLLYGRLGHIKRKASEPPPACSCGMDDFRGRLEKFLS